MWWATGVRLLQSVEQRCADRLQGIILEVRQLPVTVTYCFEEWVRIAVI
jgi:predicted component of type VI protein secretion system